MGFNQTIIIAKLNDMHMKGKHEEILNNFFNGIVSDNGEDFASKISGYCQVYAPYYICMLESDDSEYHTFVLESIKNSIGQGMHEQIWCLFSTEDMPRRAFDMFSVRSMPPNNSQIELKGLQQIERVQKIYSVMLQIGTEATAIMNDPKKGKSNLEGMLVNNAQQLPAQEDLLSAIDANVLTLAEHLDFFSPPDILLEDELCWPVKPDLDY